MQFKTNAKCTGCSSAIIDSVKKRFPNAELSLDLESTDKVLHVHGIPEDAAHAAEVEKAVEEAGFTGSWLVRGMENK